MNTQLVYPLVYTLKLENNKYYVGTTTNLNYRYSQHLTGTGANWTRLHKPIKIMSAEVGDIDLEKTKTLEYMEEFGFENVRGSYWCKIDLINNPLIKQNKP